ncbi:MAG: DUF503 domain-containing protein [Planctomycetota bacterium]
MIIGVLQAEIQVPDATSLKDKRRVLKSLKDRLHRHHQVSAAETALQDQLTRGVLGVVLAASEAGHAQSTLDRIADALRADPSFVLADVRTELITGS